MSKAARSYTLQDGAEMSWEAECSNWGFGLERDGLTVYLQEKL